MLKKLKNKKAAFLSGVVLVLCALLVMGHSRVKKLIVLSTSRFDGAATFRNTLTVSGSGGVDFSGGDIVLENDESIVNDTDGDLEFTFNDDAATLGQVMIVSSVDSPNTADSDLFEILFQANNDSSVLVNWGEIEVQVSDITDDTEDSQILFKTQSGGSSSTPLTLAGANATFGGTVDVGSDGSGANVTLYSGTAGDNFSWNSSNVALTITGTDGQDALNIDDGNVDIADDVDIDGVLTTDGINTGGIVVTDAATYAVLAANTGMIHLIGDNSQATSITLPAEAAGLNYEFWYIGAAAEAHDDTLDTENDTNFFIGGVAFADTDAGAGADEINAGVYSDGDSNSKLTLVNMAAGTKIKVTCDGTNWYITGVVFSDTVPAFADQ